MKILAKIITILPILILVACDSRSSTTENSSNIQQPESPTSTEGLSIPASKDLGSPSNPVSIKASGGAAKQKYPQLVTQPEQPSAIREKLKQAISEASGDKGKISKALTQFWNEGVANFPDSPLSSVNVTEVLNGTNLPHEIELSVKSSQSATELNSAEEMIRAAAIWASYSGDNLLPEFALQRANTMPPTTLDIAIYEAINLGIREFSQTRGKNSYASFEKWEPLANAANPIYRLLALKAAPVSVSKTAWDVDIDSDDFNRINAEPKMGFYVSYLDETDPVILAQVIRTLGRIPLPEAVQVIKKLHAEQTQKGNKILITAAEEALHTQGLLKKE